MNKAEAFAVVSKHGWLADQPASFRNQLLSRATVRSCEANTLLFEAGDLNTALLGLVDGTLEISWNHPQLGKHLIHIARPGIWLGEGLAYGLPKRLLSTKVKTALFHLQVAA